MIVPLCVCAFNPRLANRIRVIVVQDAREERKTTNTGRLACLALQRSQLVVCADGAPMQDLAGDRGDAHGRTWLLFPAPDAVPLERIERGSVARLIVPDASWAKARRMIRREPSLRGIPCATLPAGPPSAFALRRAPHADQVSTLEAIARTLAVLEQPELAHALEAWLRVFVDRTRFTRGDLSAAEVTGGIPQAAFTFRGVRPRS
jgi:DTW domain-containing protein YfiP